MATIIRLSDNTKREFKRAKPIIRRCSYQNHLPFPLLERSKFEGESKRGEASLK